MASIAIAARKMSKDPASGVDALDKAVKDINADALDNDDDKAVFDAIIQKTKELHDSVTPDAEASAMLAAPAVSPEAEAPEVEPELAEAEETNSAD
jgi:hypothetical protein